MGYVQVPRDIQEFSMKSGWRWSDIERDRFKIWLFENEPASVCLAICTVYFGQDKAQDVFHDFYLDRLDREIDKYDPDLAYSGNAFTWVCSQLRFYCLNRTKRLNREQDLPEENLADSYNLEQAFLENEDKEFRAACKQALPDCILQLDELQQAVVRLRLMELQHNEIARQLGISPDSARQSYHRALPKLVKCLKKKGLKR